MSTAVLLTKNPYADPRDGGTLRVDAFVRQIEGNLGATVHPVFVEGGDPATSRGGVPRLTLLWANLRVILGFVRIGSLSSARWYRPRVVREILELQAALSPELRIIEYSQLIAYRPAFRGPVALDMHNVESELMENYATSSPSRLKRLVARYEAWRLRRLEARITHLVDLVGVVSEHDRVVLEKLARHGLGCTVVVAPNGVADAGFEVSEPRTREIVFVAHLGWAPNVDAAEWLCQKVWPHVRAADPTVTLNLVGKSPARRVQRLAGDGVEIHPDVPSVVPYVARAGVATAPLQAAGGTRLKILEALSCGTPVVATSLGALGLEHIPAPVLTIVDDPEKFAAHLLALVDHRPDEAHVREAAEAYRWYRTMAEFLVGLEKISTPRGA